MRIDADWPLTHVEAFTSTRQAGHSAAPYASNNLGLHVGDNASAVQANRAQLAKQLGDSTLLWLNQEHTNTVISEALWHPSVIADGCYLQNSHATAIAMTADCLPIVIAHQQHPEWLVLHAGWPGLARGIVEAGVKHLQANAAEYAVWFGPCIRQDAFEVGTDVYNAFCEQEPEHQSAFKTRPNAEKYLADLVLIAKQKLIARGFSLFYDSNLCTYANPDLFFSYRRDGVTGRMATVCRQLL